MSWVIFNHKHAFLILEKSKLKWELARDVLLREVTEATKWSVTMGEALQDGWMFFNFIDSRVKETLKFNLQIQDFIPNLCVIPQLENKRLASGQRHGQKKGVKWSGNVMQKNRLKKMKVQYTRRKPSFPKIFYNGNEEQTKNDEKDICKF